MSIERTRRSLVFHLWIRLTAVTAVFTLIAIGVFVWLEMDDNLNTAREHAAAQAAAAATSAIVTGENPPPNSGSPDGKQSLPTGIPAPNIGDALGIRGLQVLAEDGSIVRTAGQLDGNGVLTPDLPNGELHNYDVKLSNNGFERTNVSPLDLVLGGHYGLAAIVRPLTKPDGRAITTPGPRVRVILEYDNISGEAQTLLIRSLLLAGGILAVAAITIWVLLNRFVSRPLGTYNATARRIANGDEAHMPDLGIYEFAQLGQTIDDMATALRRQAAIDALTGLYNVRDLRNRLPSMLEASQDADEPFAVVVCDLDNMKPVNDTYGHQAGDLMLQTVAGELTNWGGDDCTCWRTGGDEFVAALPNRSPEAAQELAQDLQRRIQSADVDLAEGAVAVNMSFGVAAYPEDGDTVNALLNAADRRMYESKTRKKGPSIANVA